ncbi:MAG TPA: diguanylate cyclase [Syntrophorhabdaceae bacterium]|nr:diguanylate cyclase [Syntrophorhabdaceae bacterium]
MNSEKRLIVIDDDESLRNVLSEYLNQAGLTVFAYEHVPDLEKMLKEKEPHAILLDIFMPRVPGNEVLKSIKKIDQRIPVIMMTGYADESKRIDSLRGGAYALLTKPFASLEELYYTVNNAMDHYLESIKTRQLSIEVEERYKREKTNLLELDFLKTLQHMIGETEDPSYMLRNVSSLLKSFLQFEYFGVLLAEDGAFDIQVYPHPNEYREKLRFITSVLQREFPEAQGLHDRRSRSRNETERPPDAQAGDQFTVVTKLSTAKDVYGYAGLFRDTPFDVQEELIFERFCSHIALTLEKIRLFREIRVLSVRDGLTGVFNHAYAMGKLESEIDRAKRYSGSFSMILLDVDNFKQINDSYGHLAGDHVLKRISQLIAKNLRTIDVVGRYGGEEFIVILPETDVEKALVAGERLRKAIEAETFSSSGSDVRLTVSLGIAAYEDGKSAHELIKTADDNLYKAKAGGKNRICYEP